MAVASWAKEKKNSRDAKILARRVLSLDQKNAAARELLGHVEVEGKWYANQKAADAALAEAVPDLTEQVVEAYDAH